MIQTTVSEAVLARLEALTARLDDQAATIAAQQARIAEQDRRIVELAARADGPTTATARGDAARTTTRRGLLRGALAAGAAVTALAVSQAGPAQAHDLDDIRRNNGTATETGAQLYNSYDTFLQPYALWGDNESNVVISSPNARVGLLGSVSGVDTAPLPRYGVYGVVDGAAPNAGVAGVVAGGAIGVYGSSQSNIGVRGQSTSSHGLYGFSTQAFGAVGQSNAGIGVYASSSTNYGLWAYSVNSFAALFTGPVHINGSLTVSGSYPKSAAVKKRNGTYARMYCQESPEPWFEDFGTAEVKAGQASVATGPGVR